MCTILNGTFCFRGAVLIMGGLILNVLVGASLYDPVQQHLKKVPVNSSKKNGKYSNTSYKLQKTTEANNDNSKSPEEKALVDKVIYESGESPIQENKVRLEFQPPSPDREYFLAANTPLLEEDIVLKNGVSHLSLNQPITNSESVQHISRKISTGSYRGKNSYLMASTGQIPCKMSISRPVPKVASVAAMSRKISVSSNISSSSFRYISTAFHGSTLVGLNPEFSSQTTMKTPQDEKPSCFCSLCSCFNKTKTSESKVQSKTKEGVYSKLLRDPVFIIILISNASTAIGYTNFTILLPVHAVNLGFDKDKASYLLSIVATLDLVGRIGGSALSDWLPINKKFYFVGGLLCSGISLMLLAHMNTYFSLACSCAAFGLSSGTYVGITAIIMVDLLGEDQLASSYGVSLFINGIIQLIGPPICGFAFEQINSYGPIITTLGLVLISGAAVWISFPFIKKNKNEQSLA